MTKLPSTNWSGSLMRFRSPERLVCSAGCGLGDRRREVTGVGMLFAEANYRGGAKMRYVLALALVTGTLVVTVLSWPTRPSITPGLSMENFSRLHGAMTDEDVYELLGSPSYEREDHDYDEWSTDDDYFVK